MLPESSVPRGDLYTPSRTYTVKDAYHVLIPALRLGIVLQPDYYDDLARS